MSSANISFEDLFNSSILDVIVPVASIGLPSRTGTPEGSSYINDKWLGSLESETVDRKLAFFGKVHSSCLTP